MAASFTPISMTGNSFGHSQMQSPLTRDFSSIGRLAANSDPEMHEPINGSARFNDPKMPECGPVGNYQFAKNRLSSNMLGEKSDIGRNRAFVIENVPPNLSYMTLAGFFNVSELQNYVVSRSTNTK